MRWRIIICLSVCAGITSLASAGTGSVFNSKHNLSVTGPGEIKTNAETRVCVFCNGSHNTSKEGPLWNHETTVTGKFKTYSRETMTGRPSQPTGATKLCLSCHDGTIAVGAIKGLPRPLPMQNTDPGGTIPSSRKSRIGTDLSGTHPVSVEYGQEAAMNVGHLKWPPDDSEKEVGPDALGQVQCTACHDPHDDSKSDKYPFWQKATFGDVCNTCHEF